MTGENPYQKALVFALRVSLGWMFLYAGMRQLTSSTWSAAQFLEGAQTFTPIYRWFMDPMILPIINFIVPWAHTLIGVSLLLGVTVRLSSAGGALLMMMYYFPRMDFPYVSGFNQFIVEYHLVYALVLLYLGAVKAGQVWGLEKWLETQPPVAHYLQRHPGARAWLT
jgi:thiosulfate dehydrogenase (quinone) large subunit